MNRYELVGIKYFSQDGEYYFAEVSIRDCAGNTYWSVAQCASSVHGVIFAAIDKALGKEITINWRFGNYSFQTLNPTRQVSGKVFSRCRVDINHPFDDGFTGICDEKDIAKGLAQAYLKAINSLFKGRKGREVRIYKAS